MMRIKVYSMRMVLIYNDIYCHIEGGFYYGSFETPGMFAEFTDFYLFFSIWESWATLKAFPLITAFWNWKAYSVLRRSDLSLIFFSGDSMSFSFGFSFLFLIYFFAILFFMNSFNLTISCWHSKQILNPVNISSTISKPKKSEIPPSDNGLRNKANAIKTLFNMYIPAMKFVHILSPV